MINRRILALTGLTIVLAAASLQGQGTDQWDPGRALVTRTDLTDLYHRLLWVADSSSYSDAMRGLARREAQITRARLDSGDFNVGDRIVLNVDNEPTLKDTFPVVTGRALNLPDIGPVPMQGVLRAELEPYLTKALGRYLRQPAVHAHSMLQIAMVEAVTRPGFFNVPSELPLTAALTIGGGPTAQADLTAIYIERGDHRIWDGAELQQAINLGLTLDQMGIRGGDRITVPARRTFTESTVRSVSMLVAIPLTIYSVTQIFHH